MKKKIVTALMVAGLMAMNVVPSFAVENEMLFLWSDQVWCSAKNSVANSGDYSYVWAGCDAVYPSSGDDTFTKIQVRVRNSNREVITNAEYVVLTEGSGVQKVKLREGYLSSTPIYYQFRGNTNSSAYAIVDYYAN